MVYLILAHLPILFKYILSVWAVSRVDYYKIGQRVRHFRKAQGLSQEQLAEYAGISLTHMSHIETGNTKLSLPVLVRLAEALHTGTDELLFDRPQSRKGIGEERVRKVLDACTPEEAGMLGEIVEGVKRAMEKYR